MDSRKITSASGAVAIVDACRYEELSGYKWKLDKRGYFRRDVNYKGGRRETFLMHRCVIGATPAQVVDHINGNSLDNRLENLRFVTAQENQMNRRKSPNKSSQFKGVGLDKKTGRWLAKIGVNKKMKYLGSFECEHEAAHAYNKAAIQYFGEFACLNPVGVEK